jgi:hypothetical protein
MASGKQRKADLKAKRNYRAEKIATAKRRAEVERKAREGVAVNLESLAECNSYSNPDFVLRGYYVDVDFQCKGCGKEEFWTARQQKWWYEVAKGGRFTTAIMCRACRRRERERQNEARRVRLSGIGKKRR